MLNDKSWSIIWKKSERKYQVMLLDNDTDM